MLPKKVVVKIKNKRTSMKLLINNLQKLNIIQIMFMEIFGPENN